MSFHERDWYKPGGSKVERFPPAGLVQAEHRTAQDVRAMWIRESRARRRWRMLRWAALLAVVLLLALRLVR